MKTLLFLVLISPLLAVPNYYVNHAATGANDGSSWANAFIHLQDALFAPNVEGQKEVWVARGTYYPDDGANQVANSTSADFSLSTDTHLLGGFAGNETLATDRDPAAHLTILSGDIEQDDLDPDSDNIIVDPSHIVGGNSANLIAVRLNTENALIDGFTITASDGRTFNFFGGNATISQCHIITSNGRGILSSNGGITLSNSSFTRCGHHAVQLNNNSSLVAINSTFSHCAGCGIWTTSNGINNVSATHCQFHHLLSQSIGYGLAIDHDSEGTLTLDSCLIYHNFTNIPSSNRGVIQLDSTGSATITNTTIYSQTNNFAILNKNDSFVGLTLTNSIIWGSGNPSSRIDVTPATISHSLIQNENPAGTNNLDGNLPTNDPLFTDPTNQDFHLQKTSPALDAGDNTATTETLDLDGFSRIVDNLQTGTATINLGPYEHTREPLPSIIAISPTRGGYQLTLSAAPTEVLTIQVSSDLDDWGFLKNITLPSDQFTSASSDLSTAYFRITRPE